MIIKRKIYIFLLLSFMYIVLNPGCNNYSITDSNNHEEFYLDYNISGGIAGDNKTLTINKSDSVFYKSRFHSIHSTFNDEKLNDIYNLLVNKDFFKLDTEYLPEQMIIDDLIFTITYQSSLRSKKVIASGYCINNCSESKWPKELKSIIEYLDESIIYLKNNIKFGKVTITSKSLLEKWAFSDKIKLSDHLGEDIGADEEIFNHFKEYYQQNKNVTYFEGDWIYRLNGSGGYSLSYTELDTFYISIHDRNQGIKWPFATKLSEISEEGLIISESDYTWLKDILEQIHYPRYFIDNTLESGEYVYELFLLHGNNF